MTAPVSRVRAGDLPGLATVGFRTRRLRAALSALGVALGVAAMLAVLGISASSRAQLLHRLDSLGTNLLTAGQGRTLNGDAATLPPTAAASAGRALWVQSAAATVDVPGAVYRNELIPQEKSGGISIVAAPPELLATVRGSMVRGRFLDGALVRQPAVVLGWSAARQLGVDRTADHPEVWLARQRFVVAGILDQSVLAPELDRDALVGLPVAQARFHVDPSPSTVYVRADPDHVAVVQQALARTVDPINPEQVDVSRPSDALAAQAAAKSTFTSLLLGLGAVALLVGGVGIANVMVVAVLERRPEIGLRRALGATRAHVGVQFLGEALALSLLGGAVGVGLGTAITAAYAAGQGWPVAVPVLASGAGVGLAAVIGAVAGLYPAARAARLSPTVALRAV